MLEKQIYYRSDNVWDNHNQTKRNEVGEASSVYGGDEGIWWEESARRPKRIWE
jgi:hypothetical protein